MGFLQDQVTEMGEEKVASVRKREAAWQFFTEQQSTEKQRE